MVSMSKKIFIILLVVFALLLGGLGGVLVERIVLPRVANFPVIRNFPVLQPGSPIVITKREEIRINEGINTTEVISRVKDSLVSVYIGATNFTGVVLSSDGLIAVPNFAVKQEQAIRVFTFDGKSFPATFLAQDTFTGVSLLKINAQNLTVIKQGFAKNATPGEKLLALWVEGTSARTGVVSTGLVQKSVPGPSLATSYELAKLNSSVRLDKIFEPAALGGVLVNKDGAIVGMNLGAGRTVRAEDMRLLFNRYLDLGKVAWTLPSITYQVLSPEQAQILNLPPRFGALVKTGIDGVLVNDFVVAVNGQDLSADTDLQDGFLAKKPGEKVRLKIIRAGLEQEIEISL